MMMKKKLLPLFLIVATLLSTAVAYAQPIISFDAYNTLSMNVSVGQIDKFYFPWTYHSGQQWPWWQVEWYDDESPPCDAFSVVNYWDSMSLDIFGGGNPWWGQYFWFDEVDVRPPTSFSDLYGEQGPWVRVQYGGRNRLVLFTGKFSMGWWFPFPWWPGRIAVTAPATVRTATFWVRITGGRSGGSATIDKVTVDSPFELSTEESYKLSNQAIMKVREDLEALKGITEDHIALVSFNRQIYKDTYELHIKVMDGDKAVIFGTDVMVSLGKP